MFQVFKNLFKSGNKKTSGDSAEETPMEKKKCKKCLRRIGFEYDKCPYCGSSDFFDY